MCTDVCVRVCVCLRVCMSFNREELLIAHEEDKLQASGTGEVRSMLVKASTHLSSMIDQMIRKQAKNALVQDSEDLGKIFSL